jgi:hypothetical protein
MTAAKKPTRKRKQPQSRSENSPSAPQTPAPKTSVPQDPLQLIGRGVVPPVLNDPKRREEMGLPADEKQLGRYMIDRSKAASASVRLAAS